MMARMDAVEAQQSFATPIQPGDQTVQARVVLGVILERLHDLADPEPEGE